MSLSDGRSITLHEILGQGSVATVYRGVVVSGWGVKRPAAVKIIPLARDIDPEDAMRHLGEVARAAACVRHPSVIQLFEVDRTKGINDAPLAPFIVTELVEGESLASLTGGWPSSTRRVPVDFATVVALRAAEALGACLLTESADGSLTSLVHGDLSPRQIIVSNQGEVKVGDFGLGPFRAVGSRVPPLTQLAYQAPEIIVGGRPSPESDVFSLGVILHELLLGPRFAPGTSSVEAVRMVRDGELHWSMLGPNIPSSLRDIIERATTRNPMGRYPHARAMASDLRREMHHLGFMDAQTCVRHAIVGSCEVPLGGPPERMKSGVILSAPSADDEDDLQDVSPPSGDTQPSMTFDSLARAR